MSGDNITVYVIRRMLDRCKFLDFLSHRKYNDTSRMLSCGTADSCAPLHDAFGTLLAAVVFGEHAEVLVHVHRSVRQFPVTRVFIACTISMATELNRI